MNYSGGERFNDKCQLNSYENSGGDGVTDCVVSDGPAILNVGQLNEVACSRERCCPSIHLNKQREACNVNRDDKSAHERDEQMSPRQLLVSGKSERQKQSTCLQDDITNVRDDFVNISDSSKNSNRHNDATLTRATKGKRIKYNEGEKLCASRIMRDYIASLPPEISIKDQMRQFQFWKSIRTEFICTLIFIVISSGSSLSYISSESSIDWIEVKSAVVVALTMCVLMNLTNNQIASYPSPCHLNPCLTLAMYISGHNNQCVTLIRLALLTIVQLLATVIGSAFVYVISLNTCTFNNSNVTFSMTTHNERLHPSNLFALEFLGSFIVIVTYLSVTDDKRSPRQRSSDKRCKNKLSSNNTVTSDIHHHLSNFNSCSFTVVAFAVVTGHLLTFKMTGASLNPIRTFGPALITNQWHHHWIYWMAPIFASLFASFTYEYIKSCKPVAPSSPPSTCYREKADQVNRASTTFLAIDSSSSDDEQSTISRHPSASEGALHHSNSRNSIQPLATSSSVNDKSMVMISAQDETCESEDDDDDRHHYHTKARVSQARAPVSSSVVSLHEGETLLSRSETGDTFFDACKYHSGSIHRVKSNCVNHSTNRNAGNRIVSQSQVSRGKGEKVNEIPASHTMTELKLISPSTTFSQATTITSSS